MNNKIIMMQSQAKRVIKAFSILSLILILLSCEKPKNDDFLLLEKIITEEFSDKDSITISQQAGFTSRSLSDYHKVKFLKESTMKIISGTDEKTGKLVESSKKEQQKFDSSIISRFKEVEGILSKEEVEFMLEQNLTTEDWRQEEISSLNIRLKGQSTSKSDLGSYCCRVSRPLYTKDKKYAIVSYSLPKKHSSVVICKKDGGKWVFIKTLEKIL